MNQVLKWISQFIPAISIRTKLILILLFFAALPWFGFRYLWEIERYLQVSQQHTLSGTSQAVATALHQRPELFAQLNTAKQEFRPKDFYVYPLNHSVLFRGNTNDWKQNQNKFKHLGLSFISYKSATVADDDYGLDVFLGRYQQSLFTAINAKAPVINYRSKENLRQDRNDHFILATQLKNGQFKRYLISAFKDGKIQGYSLPSNPALVNPLTPEKQINGLWSKTANGFLVELSMPLTLVGNKFSISSYFVDPDDVSQNKVIIASSPLDSSASLGRLAIPSTDIDEIIDALSYNDARIWVLNNLGQVLTKSGDIHSPASTWNTVIEDVNKNERWVSSITQPILNLFTQSTSIEFVDPHNDITAMANPIVEKALKGFSSSQTQLTPDKKTEIISAATPIWNDGVIIGVVVTEQTTLGIRQLRNHAMQQLFNTLFIVLLIASIGVLIFSASISRRLSRLRDHTEKAIDPQGKVLNTHVLSTSKDEIGDLTRSFSQMLQRLGKYNHYLENMSSRLSHELRTPITVVRSSLEHVQISASDEQQKYIDRAQNGLKRLNTILYNMTEASRLETTLKHEHMHQFDLQEVVKGCLQGHQIAFPKYKIILKTVPYPLPVLGVADNIAQLLDKLVNNAVEFSSVTDPIEIRLSKVNNTAELSVRNEGAYLPEGMESDVFNSMISIRMTNSDEQPHLGLGLYISAMIAKFHHGTIKAINRDDTPGVAIVVSLPLSDTYTNYSN
ncbi:proteobacterial dedicated sortase system histidine kinase [Parashewanella spongiae]|uniref:histidine kinase n=1 Tax=Parashewanella spongiae TaxID=342950 RepID=A0A3A6UBN2_9GAMM|nr:proteobacterial dedicated sortase system histidine kinase [Parashewanella spongiae]MCL1078395.1 proteobacterial dedicated sortase system histidine kinase [Parashewanella spongiae]RJY19426.1 proteobacterial dedicated sortase system histidine kinase [Parashewanella spongiae]